MERKVADADDLKREASEDDNDDEVKPQTMLSNQPMLPPFRRPSGRPVMLCRLPLQLISRGQPGQPGGQPGQPDGQPGQPEEQRKSRKRRKRSSGDSSANSKRTKKIKLENGEDDEEEGDHAEMKTD